MRGGQAVAKAQLLRLDTGAPLFIQNEIPTPPAPDAKQRAGVPRYFEIREALL